MSDRRVLQPLPLSATPDIGQLTGLLQGSASYLPVPAADTTETSRLCAALGAGQPINADVALVIATSGTTGTPKGAMHSTASLTASIDATHDHLGGPGGWLLALPPHHIAGLQVLLRSVRAGFAPITMDVSAGFEPTALVAAIASMTSSRRYTSLVPTQLVKVLEHPAATAALSEVDAVLVGGAATPPPLRRKAVEAGIPIVGTYGMSETCGGCVYDGIPLRGTKIHIDGEAPGRVVIGGPMVAAGYRGRTDHPAFADPGWFRTDDLGVVDSHGLLTIIGRADEAITTGGLTIVPQVVEAVLLSDPSISDCAVLGMPDDRLGEKVVAAVVAARGAKVTEESVKAFAAQHLDRTAVPRDVHIVDDLPRRGPGKVDRSALRALLG